MSEIPFQMPSAFAELHLLTKGMELDELEQLMEFVAAWQRGANWWIGDAARYAKDVLKLGDNYSQVFPPWMSPGMIQRCEAVARAYPPEDRNIDATWSIHMRESSRPDRITRLQAHVEAGRTSDEAREADEQERSSGDGTRWLIAFDTHYFVHRHYYSGAAVEAAMQVAEWVQRTVERLKLKGATDCVCAFEGQGSFRKALTAGDTWEGERYKDRPSKPEDLRHQLRLVRELLEGFGFCCVSVDEFEADDVLSSYARQFDGRTTIVSSDKDLRSCLSSKCNILLDVEWQEDETSGDHLPEYKWVTAKDHTEATGIPPEKWVDFQMLAGDATDGIKGAQAIGKTGSTSLVASFGSVDAAIQAAKDNDERLLSMSRGKIMAKSLVEFESKAEITRQLVTLVDTLTVPTSTRIT